MDIIGKITAVFAALAMCAAFTACGNSADSGNIPVTETSAVETTVTKAALSAEEQMHRDMVERSLLSLGNTYRFDNKIAKAADGETVTVAYLGGSITEGVGAPDKESCYAKLSFDALSEVYGGNFEYVNAGVSGTPSILGNLRVQKDVLDYSPDIVFLEFAVNDGMEQIYKESYESLIRTILKQDNEPAVILLFTVTKTGHTCQPHMSELGEYYQLPMISVPDAIQPEIEAGRMTWEDYSADEAHPNAEGHKLVAEFISNYFFHVMIRDFADPLYGMPVLPEFGAPYESAFLAEADYGNSDDDLQIYETGSFARTERRIADFEKGAWVYSGEGSEPMKMHVRGNSLFFVCKRNNSASMGKFEVYIDGKKVTAIDTDQPDGWGEPYAFQAIKWQNVHDMEVEIVPTEDSAGKTIEIFGIACSQNDSLSF